MFWVSVIGIAAQPILLILLLSPGQMPSDGLVDVLALCSLTSLFTWVVVRVGIQPKLVCENGHIVIHNPVLSFRAPLSAVEFMAVNGQIGLRIQGIGAIQPWVMSKSLFDGQRARAARKELRKHISSVRPESSSEPARRWIRLGAADALLLLPLAFAVWNVVDILQNG